VVTGDIPEGLELTGGTLAGTGFTGGDLSANRFNGDGNGVVGTQVPDGPGFVGSPSQPASTHSSPPSASSFLGSVEVETPVSDTRF